MTETTVRGDIDAALDYLEAALTGLPAYTETVAGAYGLDRIARGLSSLLLLLCWDAARGSNSEPTDIVQRLRECYGGINE